MPGGQSAGSDAKRQAVPAGEIYLEVRQIGKAQRVTAVDSGTGVEVVFTAPINSLRSEIETIARNKLGARIKRELEETAQRSKPAEHQRGRLV